MNAEAHDGLDQGGGSEGLPFLTKLAERLEVGGRASAVFGEPVEREGVTVVPVARARWGVGGGGGKRQENSEMGAGGGGGVDVTPVGYIEIKQGQSQFRWICTPEGVVKLVVGGLLALLVLRRLLR